MRIITGHRGESHITSADAQAFQAGIAGDGILQTGEQLRCTRGANDNEVYIYDGDGVMQGVHFRVEPGTYDTVAIESGMSDLNRCDIIAARYTKDASTGVESVDWHVITGSYSSGTPDPNTAGLTSGSIRDGDLVAEMAVAYVYIEGLAISWVETVAEILPNLSELEMAKTLTDVLAGKWVIARKPVSSDIINLKIPTIAAKTQGDAITYKVALPAGADSFVAIPFDGGWIGANGFRFSTGQMTVSFHPLNHASVTVSNGAFRFLLIYLKEVK